MVKRQIRKTVWILRVKLLKVKIYNINKAVYLLQVSLEHLAVPFHTDSSPLHEKIQIMIYWRHKQNLCSFISFSHLNSLTSNIINHSLQLYIYIHILMIWVYITGLQEGVMADETPDFTSTDYCNSVAIFDHSVLLCVSVWGVNVKTMRQWFENSPSMYRVPFRECDGKKIRATRV